MAAAGLLIGKVRLDLLEETYKRLQDAGDMLEPTLNLATPPHCFTYSTKMERIGIGYEHAGPAVLIARSQPAMKALQRIAERILLPTGAVVLATTPLVATPSTTNVTSETSIEVLECPDSSDEEMPTLVRQDKGKKRAVIESSPEYGQLDEWTEEDISAAVLKDITNQHAHFGSSSGSTDNDRSSPMKVPSSSMTKHSASMNSSPEVQKNAWSALMKAKTPIKTVAKKKPTPRAALTPRPSADKAVQQPSSEPPRQKTKFANLSQFQQAIKRMMNNTLGHDVAPVSVGSNSVLLGKLPSTRPAGQATPLADVTSVLSKECPSMTTLRNPWHRTFDASEATQDVDRICAGVTEVIEGKCTAYPPMVSNSPLSGTSAALLARELENISLHPMIDFRQAQWATDRFSALSKVAPFRCSYLLERLEPWAFIGSDGVNPLDEEGNGVFSFGGIVPLTVHGADSAWQNSPYVKKHLLAVAEQLLDRLATMGYARNVDIWAVLAQVLSKRLGWVWTATTFRKIAGGEYYEFAHFTGNEKAVLHQLLAYHREAESGKVVYDVEDKFLLYEDQRHVSTMANTTQSGRAFFHSFLHSKSILAMREPLFVAPKPAMSLSEEELSDKFDKIFALYKVDGDNLNERTISLRVKGTASKLTKKNVTAAISSSLGNLPMAIESVTTLGGRVNIVFLDEVHRDSAMLVVDVWMSTLSGLFPCSLTPAPTTKYSDAMRTVTFVPRSHADALKDVPIMEEKLSKTYSGTSVDVTTFENGSKAASNYATLCIRFSSIEDTTAFLHEPHPDIPGRATLEWHAKPLLWCTECQAPGHAKCTKMPVEVCKLCTTIEEELEEHLIFRSEVEAERLANELVACAARRILTSIRDKVWRAAIRRSLTHEGIHSMSEAGIRYRLTDLGMDRLSALGVKRGLPTLSSLIADAEKEETERQARGDTTM